MFDNAGTFVKKRILKIMPPKNDDDLLLILSVDNIKFIM